MFNLKKQYTMRYEITEEKLTKVYTTFDEFVEMSKVWAIDEGLGSSSVRHERNRDFFGDAPDFPTMHRRCYDGYGSAKISKSRVELSGMIDIDMPTDELRYEGDELDVPTYLSGEMRCFWGEAYEAKPPKRIHMTYASNCVAGVDDKSFANHGGAVCVIADALMSLRAQVKVTCTFTNTNVFTDKGLQAILIKDYDESVDVSRIGVTTHPSWFRRIGFRWLESFMYSIGKEGRGYGCSMTGSRRNEVVSDEEFADWLRIDADEIVIDLPAANLGIFTSADRTAEWVKGAVERIMSEGEVSKYIKIWQ
jgi:hypothetical protein